MKALFTAIKNRDNEKVLELISKKPQLVNCTAKKPPKRDDGQSPLQIAFKAKNFWAVDYFLEKGANVNFIEIESVNEWKMPVLHDAIMATIHMIRFEHPIDPWDRERKGQFKIAGEKEYFDKTFLLLKTMIDKGADANAVDSYGNTSLMRACMDIENRWIDKSRSLSNETIEDSKQIFDLLISSGADIYKATSEREPITEQYTELLNQLRVTF